MKRELVKVLSPSKNQYALTEECFIKSPCTITDGQLRITLNIYTLFKIGFLLLSIWQIFVSFKLPMIVQKVFYLKWKNFRDSYPVAHIGRCSGNLSKTLMILQPLSKLVSVWDLDRESGNTSIFAGAVWRRRCRTDWYKFSGRYHWKYFSQISVEIENVRRTSLTRVNESLNHIVSVKCIMHSNLLVNFKWSNRRSWSMVRPRFKRWIKIKPEMRDDSF